LTVGIPISAFVLGGGLPGIDKYTYQMILALERRQGVRVLVFQEKHRRNGPFDRFEICYFPILKEWFSLRNRQSASRYGGGAPADRPARPSRFRRFRREIVKSLYYLSKHVDVIHYPTHMETPLRWTACPTVLTFYDLVPLVHPETSTEGIIEKFDRCVGRLRYIDALITISEFSKMEMVNRLGLDPEKITVCYPGVDEHFFIARADEGIVRKYSGGSHYVLFVGTLEPRKNVEVLIEAFRAIRRPGMKLILAGNEGWGIDRIRRRISELGLKDQVILPGYVPEEDLPHLYRGAEVFVYPSGYEGFGIPVVEAMAAGAPVITSDVSSLPEVAGNDAILVSPVDVVGIAEAISAVLENDHLRGDLRARGVKRAGEFSWDRCADRVLSVYRARRGI
jgi:glycosyltransferase involved in cell wall biosynthesis